MDNLCQAYHWRIEDVFKLTMPQIIMLSHAAWVNHERLEEKIQRESGRERQHGYSRPTGRTPLTKEAAAFVKRKQPEDVLDPYHYGDPLVLGDKHLSELSMEEFAMYMNIPVV